jgi:hypothetical protein
MGTRNAAYRDSEQLKSLCPLNLLFPALPVLPVKLFQDTHLMLKIESTVFTFN